jgi:hypothetical protein
MTSSLSSEESSEESALFTRDIGGISPFIIAKALAALAVGDSFYFFLDPTLAPVMKNF